MAKNTQDAVDDMLLRRGLPANPDAERAILGSILLDEKHFHQANAVLTDQDWSLEKHRRIWGAMREIHERGDGINRIALANELMRLNQLESVDGLTYISSLDEGLPLWTNLDSYISIVREKAALRRIVMVSQQAIYHALSENGTAQQIASTAGDSLSSVQVGQASTSRSPQQIIDSYPGGVTAFLDPTQRRRGLPTGFTRLDEMTAGLHPGELIILGARPSVGKSALALNIAEHLTIRKQVPVAFFSLEMTADSLLTRIMTSQARVDAHKFRGGYLNRDERTALYRTLSNLMEIPLTIVDEFGITLQKIGRHARQLRKEGRLELGIVDYLQLMGTTAKSENRNLEISKATRELKMLSGELGVPFLVLSQLSRANEKRPGAMVIPQLSDLRDSGCLSVETTKLFYTGGVQCGTVSRMSTYSLNKSGATVVRSSKHIPTGSREMIRVKTRSGRFIDCTPDHKILTDQGFIPAIQLNADYSIAAVRHLPEPCGAITIPEAKWIGWMLGNGSMIGYSSPSFICSCSVVAKEFCSTTKTLFGLDPKPHRHKSKVVFQYDITAGPVRTAAGNPVKNWLRVHQLWGARAKDKAVPEWFLEQANDRSIASILSGLWETDGTVTRGTLKYSTTSYVLAWQVVWMLSRLGIFGYIDDGYIKPDPNCAVVFTVLIADWRDVKLFRDTVPMVGRKADALNSISERRKPGSNHGDRVGLWVGEEIKSATSAAGLSWRQLGYRVQGKRISQHDLARVIDKLPRLRRRVGHLISPDIYWDKFESVVTIGRGHVFDREVMDGPHNFVANGLFVHNSIEQDADSVLFIDRPETRQRDREDLKGQADIYLAKQRHGPTGKIPLLFLSQYTRFENRLESGETAEEEPHLPPPAPPRQEPISDQW